MAVLVAVIAMFYVWTLVSAKRAWRWGEPQQDFYNQLVDGFLDGQLNLKVDVAPELMRLEDPYDPAQRPPGVGLHDATYYHGKYYIYFGVVPAVVLLLPFTVVTGVDLPLPAAVGIFVLLGFFLSVAVWSDVKRRYFPSAGRALSLACVLALGLASLGPVLLRRPTMYELAIASAYCFAMGALWSASRALHAQRRREWWVAGTSLCLGLAVGSRPSYILAAPLALVPLAWWWWKHDRARESGRDVGRWGWPMVLAGAGPITVCGVLLGVYNYLRFGSVSEFGVRYILSGVYESKMTHFSASYVWFNLQNYFLTVPTWTEWFPFVRNRPWPAGPAGTVPGDGYFGVWAILPLTWFACVPVGVWWIRRKVSLEAPLRLWLASVLSIGTGTAMLLVGFYASATRYQVDFVPSLIMAGCVGALMVDDALAQSKRLWVGRMGRACLVGVALYSAALGLIVSLQSNNEFRDRNLVLYRNVARWFNIVPAWIEGSRGGRHGPAEYAVKLLPGPATGEVEVMSTGSGETHCRVFIRRDGERRIQVGFAQANVPVRVSRWFEAEAGTTHRLRIDFGPFCPFPEHPDYSKWAGGSAVAPERRLRIEWNGEGVLEDRINIPITTPVSLAWREDGARNLARTSGVKSELALVERLPGSAAGREFQEHDCVRLRLRLPASAVVNEWAVVRLAQDEDGSGVFISSSTDSSIRIVRRHHAVLVWQSEVWPVDRAAVHEVVFRLRRPSGDAGTVGRADWWLECVWNGAIIASQRLPHSVGLGGFMQQGGAIDLAPKPDTATKLDVFSREQFARGQDPLLARYGAVRMKVVFPVGKTGQGEPLVTSGATGRGDFFWVEYVDDTHVRFAFDAWGQPTLKSAPVAVDFRRSHDISVMHGGLMVGPDAGPLAAVKESRITVRLDGVEVWTRATGFHPSAADEIYLGSNLIGGTTCGPRFSGQLLEVERLEKEAWAR